MRLPASDSMSFSLWALWWLMGLMDWAFSRTCLYLSSLTHRDVPSQSCQKWLNWAVRGIFLGLCCNQNALTNLLFINKHLKIRHILQVELLGCPSCWLSSKEGSTHLLGRAWTSHPSALSWDGAGHFDTPFQQITPSAIGMRGPIVQDCPFPSIQGLAGRF